MRLGNRACGRQLFFYVVATVGVPVLGLATIEGGSSLILFLRDVSRSVAASRPREWVTFDPRVGSVPRPNTYLGDMFGPGVYLRTNAQGFRNLHDFTLLVPEGRVRFICSGDSYTLGQGVANHESWCDLLTRLDPTLESANLGMSGYGFDQAYFRYLRQGEALEHDLHLFAFITADLYRMRGSWEWSWQRGGLEANDGNLVVPERVSCLACTNPYVPALVVNLKRLRSLTLLDRMGRKLGLGHWVNRDREIHELAAAIITDLASRAAAGNSSLALVHLPTIGDYTYEHSLPWRDRLRDLAAGSGAAYIDLIGEFRRLPGDSLRLMFLPREVDPGEHYTATGHAWVAEHLNRHLRLQGLWRSSPPVRISQSGVETGGP